MDEDGLEADSYPNSLVGRSMSNQGKSRDVNREDMSNDSKDYHKLLQINIAKRWTIQLIQLPPVNDRFSP